MNPLDNTNKLKSSTNYYFCNVYLPDLFFHKPELFMNCLTNEKRIHEILKIIFTLMSGDGFDTKDFTELEYEIRREGEMSGILLAIPNSIIEPECNFVALCFKGDQLRYYESELYEDGYYGLCSRNKERMHLNHGRVIDDIKTFDDMWKAINPKKQIMIIKDLQTNPFKQFDETWALLTAGDINNHNSMTISWGEMGTLWGKNVVTVFVKPCRNTYSFMNNNDYFVLSFFDEEYRKALLIMGSHSGRDVNKDELSKLTPMEYKDVTIYKEAKVTLICKKIYFNDIDINNVPKEAKERYYEVEKPHRMFIGEVIEIINK